MCRNLKFRYIFQISPHLPWIEIWNFSTWQIFLHMSHMWTLWQIWGMPYQSKHLEGRSRKSDGNLFVSKMETSKMTLRSVAKCHGYGGYIRLKILDFFKLCLIPSSFNHFFKINSKFRTYMSCIALVWCSLNNWQLCSTVLHWWMLHLCGIALCYIVLLCCIVGLLHWCTVALCSWCTVLDFVELVWCSTLLNCFASLFNWCGIDLNGPLLVLL